METREHNVRPARKRLLWAVAILLLAAVGAVIGNRQGLSSVNPHPIFIEKLRSAKHFRSSFPAQAYARQVVRESSLQPASLKKAAVHAIGMEPREVRHMASGNPESVFAMLSHLGGLGEIVWVDDWTNLPVKLPPTSIAGQVVLPRRYAVQAALDAVRASGGCLIEAGKDRYLVAKVSERREYEAAIRALGWLDGTPPPWVQAGSAEPGGAANRSQPVQPRTNRASAAAGSGR
jgi:hypothetical protein